jgi:hypothetical protein
VPLAHHTLLNPLLLCLNLPSLQEFVEPIIEDMDPENCIEEEYR